MSNDLIGRPPTDKLNVETQRGGAASSLNSGTRQAGFDLIDFTTKELSRELIHALDEFSLEDIVEAKISRFLDQMGGYFQETDNLHHIILRRVEKPLFRQVMQRTGGNQVHAARILGINRNTLRKKIKLYDL